LPAPGDGAAGGAARFVLESDLYRRRARYAEAQTAAARAVRIAPDSGTAQRAMARASSVLAARTPGWRPELGGSPVRGVGVGASGAAGTAVRGRVLHIVSDALPVQQTGYTLRTQAVARCQRDAGLDPWVATRGRGARADGTPLARGAPGTWHVEGIEYRAIGSAGDLDDYPDRELAQSAAAASRLVDELRPAVLHAATAYHNLQVCLALRDRHHIPVVYEVRGFREEIWLSRAGDLERVRGRYAVEQAAETAAMRDADLLVTLSEGMRRHLVERSGIDEDRIAVVPNAADPDRFAPMPRDATLAARLGIGDDPVIGYVSGFAPYEGIPVLLRATAELRRRGRRLRCLLVGGGTPDERGVVEATRSALGLDDGTVILAGQVAFADVPRYLSLLDIFVVPRTGDRVSRLVTPLKPYEAMAMELAVVASRVEALLEIVTHGETGITFEPDDHASLADAIEPLLDDPVRRRDLGEAARAWIIANRTWALNGGRYRELYERLGVA
jgi:glycosyltransferase involved in cell wall biosynthesis